MSVAPLLGKLIAVGVSISSDGVRLIVDAPAGVVTAELRAELRERKAELIAALEAECVRPNEEPSLIDVRREIADLLAIAYRRYAAAHQVGRDARRAPGDSGLANFPCSSVHGVVP